MTATTSPPCSRPLRAPPRSRAARRLPLTHPAWPMLVFGASAALLLAALFTALPLPWIHPLRAYGFFDLKVYRLGAGVVLSGRPLYSLSLPHHLGFSYPPFAALVVVWLHALPVTADEALVTAGNIALVALIAHRTLELRRPGRSAAGSASAWLLAAAALWIEPIASAIAYGQIDLLIAALVLVDLTRGETRRWGGFGVGLAAAIKLTPLIFIPYLLLTGRRRMAGRASLVFALSIAIGFDLLGSESLSYWGGGLFDTTRVTGRPDGGGGPADQSLHGLLLRIDPGLAPDQLAWLACGVLIGGLGLRLAVRASRRGERDWGFVLIAITGLLVSPISWTHHWTIAVPGLLLVLGTPGRGARARLLRAAAALLAVSSWLVWPVIVAHGTGTGLTPGTFVLGDLDVLAGLAVIAAAGVRELCRWTHPADPGAVLVCGRSRSTDPAQSGGRPPLVGRELGR